MGRTADRTQEDLPEGSKLLTPTRVQDAACHREKLEDPCTRERESEKNYFLMRCDSLWYFLSYSVSFSKITGRSPLNQF